MHPSYGGPCQGIRNSIPELTKNGVINEVVSLDDPNDDFIEKDNFIINALGKGKGPWSYNPGLIQWLLNNFERFDAVIVHGLWQYHGFAVYKALRKYKKKFASRVSPKIFVMPHGMLDPYFQKAEGRKIKALRNIIYWQIIEKRLINSANAILFTCEEEMNLAKLSFSGYHPNKEINIGYGIQNPPANDMRFKKAFMERCSGIKEQYFLFLSRLHEKKGVDLLIKAYLKLKTEGYDLPNLVIAGPGLDSPFGNYLRGLALNDPEIFFPGMLSGDAKWGAFYGSSAFVLPSHQENFGIAVVEGLACGKPVLITDRVNIWREIENSRGGLVTTDTEDGVYNILKEWRSKSIEEIEAYGTGARLAFTNYYTIESAAGKLVSAIM